MRPYIARASEILVNDYGGQNVETDKVNMCSLREEKSKMPLEMAKNGLGICRHRFELKSWNSESDKKAPTRLKEN